MSLENVATTETNVRELTIKIDKETFDKATDKVFHKNAAKMNVPGFRKGKAPRSIIEKMYGKGVFYEDALDDIIPGAYQEALTESGLDVVSRPEFDIDTIDENGVVLKAKVYVYPETALKSYKGLKIEKTVKPVTDEDVDHEIGHVQERNARTVDVTDRAAEMGDTVTFDFDGSVDGVHFDGGKAENYSLKLGSGQFIPGFEEQIAGKNIGDEFDVNVTFPEDYQAEELKGKAAVFACKLHAISKSELPALDDDFAKDVSEFDTLDEYKADLKAKMEERNAGAADREAEEALIGKLIDNLEAEIPACMFDNEVENQVRDFDNRLRQQGMELSMYFKYTGMDLEGLREQMRPNAERQVKARLALEAVAKKEKIEASDEDIDAELEKIAKAYNMEVEQVKLYVDRESVAKDITVQKAMEVVKAAAKITEKTED